MPHQRRLVGSGGMGASAFQNSTIPDLSGVYSSERSIGRNHVPNPSELSEVHLWTQKLSDQQREMEEQQRKYYQEMQQMREDTQRFQAEQQRLNMGRWKQLMDSMSAYPRPSMPSSSYYPPQQMHQMQPYDGAFQPYSGGFQPSFQSPYSKPYSSFNNSQPQQLHQQQPQPQQQPDTDLNTDLDQWFNPDPNINLAGRYYDQE